MGRAIVAFSDFSGGEFGSLGPWSVPPNTFTGQNVVRYIDGSLGPRNGLKAYTVTGLPASETLRMGTALGDQVWLQQTVAPYAIYTFFSREMGSQAAIFIVNGGVILDQWVQFAQYVYASVAYGAVREVNFAAGTSANVAGSPGGTMLVRYGDRYLVAGEGSTNRIRYSATALVTSWPAANFIDVGDTDNLIVSMVPLRNAVAIVTVSHYGYAPLGRYRWWLLTGVPGVNESLREVTRGQGPVDWLGSSAMPDGSVFFAAANSENPATFNGTVVRPNLALSLGSTGVNDLWSTSPMRDSDDVLVVSDVAASSNVAYGLFRRQGSWTKQSFAEANVGHRTVVLDQLAPNFLDPFNAFIVVLAGKGSTPLFYSWLPYNDRPPFASDSFATILDNGNVFFSMPEWWSREGEEVAVRSVIVSFTKWNTGDSNVNRFDVDITPKRTYEGGDATALSTANGSRGFSEATSASSTTGTSARRQFNFEEVWGNGFQVKIKNIRGVSIAKIHVVLDTKKTAGI